MIHGTVPLRDGFVAGEKIDPLNGRGHRVSRSLQQGQHGLGVLFVGERPGVIVGQKGGQPLVGAQDLHQHFHMVQLLLHVPGHHAQQILAVLGELLIVLDGVRGKVAHPATG